MQQLLYGPTIAVALVMMFIGTCAELPEHQQLRRSKANMSMIRAGIQAKEGRLAEGKQPDGGVAAGESGVAAGEYAADAHGSVSVGYANSAPSRNGRGVAEVADDDDDDDDDEDDDDKKDAADEKRDEAKAEMAEAAKAAAIASAVEKQRDAQYKLQDFNDDAAFDNKVAAEVVVIANETQSLGLSKFLGVLRIEMRAYSKPSYSAHLESRLAAASRKVAELEGELGKGSKVEVDNAKAKGEDDEGMKKEKKVKSEKVEDVVTEGFKREAAMAAQKAGETWAISFFADVVLMAVVFAMASATNTGVRQGAWFLIDQVVAIFLAVMYFQAFDSLLDFLDMGLHNHLLCSILHAVVMLALVLGLAGCFRRNGIGLAIVCGAGAHIVSFSSIHAAATVQNKVWVSWSYSWLMCIFGMLVLGLGLAIISYLVYSAKKQTNLVENDDFMDKTDDLENDFGAMAFSVVFTMFMRFVITGHHPVDDDTEFDHTTEDRFRMLIYACLCLIVAGFVVSFCSQKAEQYKDNYPVKRLMTFFTTVATMNVAWAFLYWGEWQFFEALYPGEAIKGRVMFAIVSTCLGCLAIVGLSSISSAQLEGKAAQRTAGKSEMQVALTAISLIIAWSWELCFDAAVEDMTAGVSHPAAWKITSTVALFAIVLPVYAYSLKPACIRNAGDA